MTNQLNEELSENEVNKNFHVNMDATVWASEFMKITGGVVDEQTMVAWFANAIMCGWDSYSWESNNYNQKLASLAKDAVNSLRYIEQSYGRLYGVGWDRVFDAADETFNEEVHL